MFCTRIFLMVGMVLSVGSVHAMLQPYQAALLVGGVAGVSSLNVHQSWQKRKDGVGDYITLSEKGTKIPLATVGAVVLGLAATGCAGAKVYPRLKLDVVENLLKQAHTHANHPCYVNEPGRLLDRKTLERCYARKHNPYNAAFDDLEKGQKALDEADRELALTPHMGVIRLPASDSNARKLALKVKVDAFRETITDRMLVVKACPGYNGGKPAFNSALY